jgi:calcineurin-like phosphoesterase family protein
MYCMLRIAHIADVHVRSLSRHEEYREVFSAFVQQCKDQGVQHVFVGGDTFHTKTAGMSPECINLMCWLFTELASAAEVHLTLGNHDLNLQNLSRQDAISPIVQALNNPRIHLYKHSGTYEFSPGYVWGVFSLFDEDNWDVVKPVPGKVNIACYHGSVWGATTETDWLIEEGITMEFFKGWDFCFLGDIHRTQFLAGRDVEITIDEADLAKYPDATVIG